MKNTLVVDGAKIKWIMDTYVYNNWSGLAYENTKVYDGLYNYRITVSALYNCVLSEFNGIIKDADKWK